MMRGLRSEVRDSYSVDTKNRRISNINFIDDPCSATCSITFITEVMVGTAVSFPVVIVVCFLQGLCGGDAVCSQGIDGEFPI